VTQSNIVSDEQERFRLILDPFGDLWTYSVKC